MKKLSNSAPLLVGGVLLCSTAAPGDTFHVSPCGSNNWSGLSAVCTPPDGPKRTIQAGINLAGDGDEVVVADGIYTGSGNVNLSFDGYAITVRSASGIDSDVSLVNSIVSGNGGGGIVDVFGPETDVSYSLVGGGWSGPGPGNLNADPRFADPDGPDDVPGTADDDLRLRPGSPCIDAGDNSTPGLAGVTTDAGGDARFFDDPDTPDTGSGQSPVVDMGGYEFQGNDCPLDIDGDGTIGFGDILRILAAWGNAGGPEDVDGDKDVGFGDVLLILAEWGVCP